MLLCLQFLIESLGIPFENFFPGLRADFFIPIAIVTARAAAVLAADVPSGKALAVDLEALGAAAVALLGRLGCALGG